MTEARALIRHAFYGDELDRLQEGGWFTRETMARLDPKFASVSEEDLAHIGRVLRAHFVRRNGIFGGQITAGDGYFIGLFMAAMRPAAMIEVGVASGYSSALILSFAEALGLLDKQPYLFSYDLMETHANGHVTGSLLREQFSNLVPFWQLETQVTTATLDADRLRASLPVGPVMAFLDGGHSHPWPAIDLCFLETSVPQCKWALMQDVQMIERWLADAIIYGAAVPPPVRGVQFAVTHWPQRKMVGSGLSYNMAAMELPAGERFIDFLDAVNLYPFETSAEQARICKEYLDALKANRAE